MPHTHALADSFLFQNKIDYQIFKQCLLDCNFTDKGVIEALGVKDISSINEKDLSLLLKSTQKNTPLNTFIRLFLIEHPCEKEQVKKALSPIEPESLVNAGLIRVEKDRVWPAVKLIPFHGLHMVFDRQERLDSPDRQDYVMGVGSSTITLSNLTIRKQSGRALDLGTGCGTLALMAASHSDHVTAADLNSRAVA
ncbi:MAG: methyltransferase, partial [Desulfobacteraceae bacterium]|nr:methyltransferase [Desulfobacteraceae bacterium]